MTLTVGGQAPDFELPNQYGEPVRLSGFRGGNVVVVFYPFAFSGICTSELCELRDNLDSFVSDNARIVAVSVDSKYTLRAYARAEGYDFDLLSDFWPHGQVAKAYGVFNEERGMANRGTFIIDAQGIIRDIVINPAGEARSLEGYRRALAELNS